MKKLFGILGMIVAVALFFTVGCEKNAINESQGRLVVNLTDAPFPFDMIEEANVVITKVDIRAVGDTTGNPFIVLSEDTMEFNLLDLRNGVVTGLADVEIPAGDYDLVRLFVEEASLKIKDGDVYTVKVPSGAQTGIKIFVAPPISVQGGLTSELLLDFDLEKSFVLKGNMNTPAGIKGFNFKPVIRAVNNTTAGRIEGFTMDTAKVKIDSVSVWLQKDTVIAKTLSDTSSHYTLIGIPAGTYDLYAAKAKFDTLKVAGIKIYSGNVTKKDLFLVPKK